MRFTLAFLSCIVSVTMRLNAEIDVGRPAGGTPYDAHLGPVRQTYSRFSGGAPSVSDVRAQMRTAYRFRYYFDPAQPYTPQLPSVTESRQQGDCKAKSLWVAYKMDDRKVRFVVGRIKSVTNMSHAWLIWKGPTGWMVLDPTFYSRPLDMARLGPGEFTMLYSYTAGGKFVHGAPKKAESKYGDHG